MGHRFSYKHGPVTQAMVARMAQDLKATRSGNTLSLDSKNFACGDPAKEKYWRRLNEKFGSDDKAETSTPWAVRTAQRSPQNPGAGATALKNSKEKYMPKQSPETPRSVELTPTPVFEPKPGLMGSKPTNPFDVSYLIIKGEKKNG